MARRKFIPNVRLISARRLEGWTQEELAVKVNKSFSWISRIEQGRDYPSKELAKEIAALFGADPVEMFPETFEDK